MVNDTAPVTVRFLLQRIQWSMWLITAANKQEGSIVAEERRVRKLQEIRQLLSIALGPDVDLNQEAKNLIAQWRVTAAMEIRPPKASAPLQCLLREYHEICKGIRDIEDEKRPSKK